MDLNTTDAIHLQADGVEELPTPQFYPRSPFSMLIDPLGTSAAAQRLETQALPRRQYNMDRGTGGKLLEAYDTVDTIQQAPRRCFSIYESAIRRAEGLAS